MCGTEIPAHRKTCSTECKTARYKKRDRERYAANREAVRARTAAWYLANREYAREQSRQRREKNREAIREDKKRYARENAERIAERQHAWYLANRERLRAEWQASQTDEDRAKAAERTREWAAANPERRAELRRQWAQENPEKVRAVRVRRRARLHSVPADLVSPQELLRDQDGLCYLCLLPISEDHKVPHPLSLSVDHVIPLARGGTGLRENLRATHLLCNLQKGARFPDELSKGA
jgi:predicted nucleic acid-binding Zn ribbon protein